MLNKNTAAQQITTYWYNNGVVDSVFYQTDVFSFRCPGGIAYTGTYNSAIIDSIKYHGSRRDRANDVFFNSSTTLAQRLTEAQNIYTTGLVQTVYLNVSKDPNLNYSSNNWYTLDNLILVNFTNTYPTATELNNFMTQYNLTLHYQPLANLPTTSGCSYTYIFDAQVPQNENGVPDFEYFVQLIRDMYTNASGTICNVSPNFVNHGPREDPSIIIAPPPPPTPTAIYPFCGTSSPNDDLRDYQWYVKNDGYNEDDFGSPCNPATLDGTIGADAKICNCWDLGLSGTNIKIAVMSTGNINIGHDDLSNQIFTDKWDCTVHPCIPLVTSVAPYTNTGALMNMVGIIGANKNNTIGIAGIAPNAQVIPMKIGSETVSDADVVAALQQALKENYDIIALDYFSEIENASIKIELFKHHEEGRKNNGIHNIRGTIIIAPSGHTNSASIGSVVSKYPAKYNLNILTSEPEVIGVIASNRYDKLEKGEGMACNTSYIPNSINYAYPSNYGSQYDVAAPVSGMLFAPEGNSWFYTRGESWSSGIKQSADAVAITAGVAALILETNVGLKDDQIQRKIRDGADKVGGYTYGGLLNKSVELAGGRLNCLNAFNHNGAPQGVGTIEMKNIKLAYTTNRWSIDYLEKNSRNIQYTVYNILGCVIETNKTTNQFIEIDNTQYALGIYFIKLSSNTSNITLKVIK